MIKALQHDPNDRPTMKQIVVDLDMLQSSPLALRHINPDPPFTLV